MITAEEVNTALSQLGFTSEVLDSNYVLIRNYSICTGWSCDVSDMLLELPPNFPSSAMYGILIPQSLICNTDKKITVGRLVSEATLLDVVWDRLSFQTVYKEDLKIYINTHLKNANKVLSFKNV